MKNPLPSSQPAKDNYKVLEKITASGDGNDSVFEDWLDMVKASLEALPGHLKAQQTGQPYTDTPENQKLWRQLNSPVRVYC
jgi:hypothetical protein